MNKSDLIDALSTKENLTEKNASEIINMVLDGFTDTLKKGGRIEIRGFGSFCVREYDGYTGRIPIEGTTLQSYERLRTEIDDSNRQISNLSNNNQTLQVQLQNLMGTYQTSVTITSNLFRQYSDGLQDIISNIR